MFPSSSRLTLCVRRSQRWRSTTPRRLPRLTKSTVINGTSQEWRTSLCRSSMPHRYSLHPLRHMFTHCVKCATNFHNIYASYHIQDSFINFSNASIYLFFCVYKPFCKSVLFYFIIAWLTVCIVSIVVCCLYTFHFWVNLPEFRFCLYPSYKFPCRRISRFSIWGKTKPIPSFLSGSNGVPQC